MHLPASGGEGLRSMAWLEHTNSRFSAVKGREPKMLIGSPCSRYGGFLFLRHGQTILPA
jgi:hypothetical protein